MQLPLPLPLFFRRPLFASVAVASAAFALRQPANRAAALQSLVAAERGFAKTSVDHGIRDAFLANLAADAIVFRPGPVPGRAAYENTPASPAYLNWEPVIADVSASGNLGFTSGPYELRPRGASDSTRRYGHYVTLWKRDADGRWKVALDIGTPHTKPPAERLAFRESDGSAFADPEVAHATLLRADSAFGTGAPPGTGLTPALATDVRLYRAGVVPLRGKPAVVRTLAAAKRSYQSTPLAAVVASSADFGYSYGEYTLTGANAGDQAGYYLRVWRRQHDGAWEVILDLATPAR
jgi:ketosteroid isomerase-like protein